MGKYLNAFGTGFFAQTLLGLYGNLRANEVNKYLMAYFHLN